MSKNCVVHVTGTGGLPRREAMQRWKSSFSELLFQEYTYRYAIDETASNRFAVSFAFDFGFFFFAMQLALAVPLRILCYKGKQTYI